MTLNLLLFSLLIKYFCVCLQCAHSDHGAEANEDSRVEEGLGGEKAVLLEGNVAGLVCVASGGQVAVNQVSCESLDSDVDLVAHNVASKARHSEVRPVSTLHTVDVLVVLNHVKSILKGISVEEGV